MRPWTRPIIVAFISQNWQSDDIPGVVLKVYTLFTLAVTRYFLLVTISRTRTAIWIIFISCERSLHPDLSRPATAHAHNSSRAP